MVDFLQAKNTALDASKSRSRTNVNFNPKKNMEENQRKHSLEIDLTTLKENNGREKST
jgi:hypothetical protein